MMAPNAPALTTAYPLSKTHVKREKPMPKLIALFPICIEIKNSDTFAVY